MQQVKQFEEIKKHWKKELKIARDLLEMEFERHSEENGVSISHYKGSERGIVIKGETIVENCSVDQIQQLLETPDWNIVKEYDKKAKYFKEIEKFDNNWRIRHFIFSSPSRFVSERDFILVGHPIEETTANVQKGWLSTSIDEYYPFNSHHDSSVRGTNHFTLYNFHQIGNNVKCTMLIQSNPNGMIPTSLVNQALHERPNILFDMSQYLSKTNKLQ